MPMPGKKLCASFVVALLTPLATAAQQHTFNIFVVDPSGAIIPQASVVLHAGNVVTQQATVDRDGIAH